MFTAIKRISYKQIGRHIESFIKQWIEDITQEVPHYSKPAYNTWGMKYLLKIKSCVHETIKK